MTTNVNKLQVLYNMRPHKAKRIVTKLKEHLPRLYVSEVIARLKEQGITVNSQHVRDVKRFQRKDPKVLGVILDFAVENEKATRKLENLAEDKH